MKGCAGCFGCLGILTIALFVAVLIPAVSFILELLGPLIALINALAGMG